MTPNGFGRANAEAPTPPADRQGASPASPYTNGKHPITMGATPYTPVFDDLLALVRESDENATDGDPRVMDEWISYRIRWNAFLAQGGQTA